MIYRIFLVYMLTIFSSNHHVVFAQEKIVRLTTGEYAPYISETLPHGGVAARIVTEAFEAVGYQVEISYFPWKRAYLEAQEGKNYEGTLVWFKTDERLQHFHFSDAVIKEEQVFFHLKSNAFNWNTLADLKPYTIGVINGFTYGAEMDRAIKDEKMSVAKAVSGELNYKKLKAGRIDLFPQIKEIGYYTLKKHFKGDVTLFTHHSKALQEQYSYVLFSKKNGKGPHLTEQFNKGMKQLREKGKIQKYLDELLQ